MNIIEKRLDEIQLIAGTDDIAMIGEKYAVTRDGRVFTFWSKKGIWKEQKYRKHSNGYLRVTLYGKDQYLHRVVADYFCKKSDGCFEVNHIDGNKENNRADNLEWCTRSQNNKHAFVTGLRNYDELKQMANCDAAMEAHKRNRAISYEKAEEIRSISGKTDREIARLYGISRGTVWQIRNGVSYRYA